MAGCVAPQEADVSVPVEELAKAGAYESALGVAAVVTAWTGFPQPALAYCKVVP